MIKRPPVRDRPHHEGCATGPRTYWLLPVALILATIAILPRPAAALPILGGQLFYTGGNVTVTVLQKFAGFNSELRLYDDSLVLKLGNIAFASQTNLVVNFNPSVLGFNPTDELVFGIRVIDTGDIFFMGPASRNPDNVFHAQTDNLGGGNFFVGFEDLFGGGDKDYDDMRFQFSGGVIGAPEPTTLALMGLALAGVGFQRRKAA